MASPAQIAVYNQALQLGYPAAEASAIANSVPANIATPIALVPDPAQGGIPTSLTIVLPANPLGGNPVTMTSAPLTAGGLPGSTGWTLNQPNGFLPLASQGGFEILQPGAIVSGPGNIGGGAPLPSGFSPQPPYAPRGPAAAPVGPRGGGSSSVFGPPAGNGNPDSNGNIPSRCPLDYVKGANTLDNLGEFRVNLGGDFHTRPTKKVF